MYRSNWKQSHKDWFTNQLCHKNWINRESGTKWTHTGTLGLVLPWQASSASHNYFKVSEKAWKGYGAGTDEGAASFDRTMNRTDHRRWESRTFSQRSNTAHPCECPSSTKKESEVQTEPGKAKQKNQEDLRTGPGPEPGTEASCRSYALGHSTGMDLLFPGRATLEKAS